LTINLEPTLQTFEGGNFQQEEIMISRKIIVALALVFMLAGCAGMTRSEQNVLGGGAVGAGLGAAIGAAAGGNPAMGAAIGGAAGLVGGALKDSWERNNGYYDGYYDRSYPPPRRYYEPAPY
jgi:osmotically inducible lipoprotein OsmB